MKIRIIHGPNLNLLGTREPEIYGDSTQEDILYELRSEFPEVAFSLFQSNVEGELVNALQRSVGECDAILLNAAAYTHTSVALADCLAAIDHKVIEIHLSNIHARESYREKSLTGRYCEGVITGFGIKGYKMAVRYLLNTR
jgi:3-dehydroquinate dehydratase-2